MRRFDDHYPVAPNYTSEQLAMDELNRVIARIAMSHGLYWEFASVELYNQIPINLREPKRAIDDQITLVMVQEWCRRAAKAKWLMALPHGRYRIIKIVARKKRR